MRILLVLLAACGATPHRKPTDGSIAGLVRDRESGDPVGMADIRIANGRSELRATSSRDGLYSIDHLKPGRYSLRAQFAGQPISIRNIDVKAGEATFVDVTFTLGKLDPIEVDYGDPKQGEITRYHPKLASPTVGLIEGTVTEFGTHERVVGAVITAVGARGPGDTLQSVTDEQGRYHFDAVVPGVYAISAYYSIGGRGQVEVRRSDIAVAGGERVEVPIWVELTKQ